MDISETSKQFTAPILYSYVNFILKEATKKNITRIYFLARDGYILYRIAKLICDNNGKNIECRYLYCSRQSLRTASYFFLGDEALDLICIPAARVSISMIFKRACIPYQYYKDVLCDIGYAEADLDKDISYVELLKIKHALSVSTIFMKIVDEVSRLKYESAIGYFRQEGLLDVEYVCIADSGWTGSMQRSLRQILSQEKKNIQLVGFYFGLYSTKKDEADGIYIPWYFSESSGTLKKVLFNNNLLECMMSAPHGMTIGYELSNNKYIPVMAESAYNSNSNVATVVNKQIYVVLKTVETYIRDKCEPLEKERIGRLILDLMVLPSKEIARIYGEFVFSDDSTEFGLVPLASLSQCHFLKQYLIYRRILCKLFFGKREANQVLFWPYGTAAFLSSKIERYWYVFNIALWEWLKVKLK